MGHGLKAGKLPDDCKYIEIRINNFRRQLEDAVIAVRGEPTMTDAAHIQTALRWERHGCLAQRWLQKEYDKLKAADRLLFSREICRASAERDKAVRELKLTRDEVKDLWSVIDAKPQARIAAGGSNGR